jgi:hypothetical protein
MEARSSVDVVSTDFAHRRQRKTSTEAISGESILTPAMSDGEEEPVEYESDDDDDDELSKWV